MFSVLGLKRWNSRNILVQGFPMVTNQRVQERHCRVYELTVNRKEEVIHFTSVF